MGARDRRVVAKPNRDSAHVVVSLEDTLNLLTQWIKF
jgi:hypothetical protein